MIFSKKQKKALRKEQEKKIRKGKALGIPVLSIRGGIFPDALSPSWGQVTTTPQDVYEKILLLEKLTPSPEAVLLEVNCFGGAITASSEISEMVAALRERYRVIGWIRDVAASGGYEVAASAEFLYAHPTSLVGSIGVLFGHQLDFSRLLEQWGVQYRQLRAGDFKDIGSPFRPMTETEKAFLEDHLQKAHEYFKKVIRQRRSLSEEEIEKVSNGLFWHGQEALELKLVDKLGNLLTLRRDLEEEYQKEVIFLFEEEPEESFLKQLLLGVQSQRFWSWEGLSRLLWKM